MQSALKEAKVPAKCRAPEGTWFQITFTLDPEHYRTLWQRAEEEHRTIPDLARESIISFLEDIGIASRKIKIFGEQDMGDLL